MELEFDLPIEQSVHALEKEFNAVFIKKIDKLFSIIIQKTEIPWIQFIPSEKELFKDPKYVGRMYNFIHNIAFKLQEIGYGHFNVAKIGNLNKHYHIHLVFRDENDECWPNPIWGCKELKNIIPDNKKILKDLENILENI